MRKPSASTYPSVKRAPGTAVAVGSCVCTTGCLLPLLAPNCSVRVVLRAPTIACPARLVQPPGSGGGQPRRGMSLAGGRQAFDVLAGASSLSLIGWTETAGILQAYNRGTDRRRSPENGCRSEHMHMDQRGKNGCLCYRRCAGLFYRLACLARPAAF